MPSSIDPIIEGLMPWACETAIKSEGSRRFCAHHNDTCVGVVTRGGIEPMV